jgi:uncharacterized membrane protein
MVDPWPDGGPEQMESIVLGYGAGLGFGIGGWMAMLGCIALVVGVIAVVAWLVARGSPATPPAPVQRPAGGDALELLRLRFARGEISADEYLAAKQVLEADR